MKFDKGAPEKDHGLWQDPWRNRQQASNGSAKRRSLWAGSGWAVIAGTVPAPAAGQESALNAAGARHIFADRWPSYSLQSKALLIFLIL